MKILLTGGGSGGHFWPLIAVAEQINTIVDEEKLLDIKMYYMADDPYDKKALFDNGITYIGITSGKQRLYSSVKNFFDKFKIATGCGVALLKMFFIFPDVVFSKGGYVSIPAVVAARILRIPVVIHESDSVPGRANMYTAKFAKRIALSYDVAATYFPKEKVAVTGQPVRKDIIEKSHDGMFDFFKLDPSVPVILILGGSLGSEAINETLIDALPVLLTKYQVIHQTGVTNWEPVTNLTSLVLEKSPHKERYHPFKILNTLEMKMAAGAASLIITRAGSTLFEIANWGVPSIIIPMPEDLSTHQIHNAFRFARAGAAIVIEQGNLNATILTSEVDRILQDSAKQQNMADAAKKFATPNAARMIAQELVDIALEHEK